MFDFEKLTVYKKAKEFNISVFNLIKNSNYDFSINRQLRRAALSIMLNIAEGSGRRTNPDKSRFYTISRGSVFECAAIIDLLKELYIDDNEQLQKHTVKLEELSKILFALIRNLSNKK